MIDIVLATGNEHKRTEIGKILPGIRFSLPSEHGVSFNVQEDGATFFENALLKARYLYDRVRLPVLADDSGLCVESLGGEPGIYSARYGSAPGGPLLKARDRNRYLLTKMEGIRDRRAVFVCCMVLVMDTYRVFSAQETVEGVVAHTPRGSGGFGYDPVFYIPEREKTMAELTEEEKNMISHRGRAGAALLKIIQSL